MHNSKQSSCPKIGVSAEVLRIFVAAAFIAVAVGCGKEKKRSEGGAGKTPAQGSLIVGEMPMQIAEMGSKDVIVSVNGDQLTRAGYEEILDVLEFYYKNKKPRAKADDVKMYRQYRARSLVGEYVMKQLLLQEANRRGLKATQENLDFMLNLVLADAAKMKGKTINEFLASAGHMGDLVRKDMKEQALIRTLRQAEFGGRLTITDDDVKKAKENIAKYNLMCDATNALVHAHANDVYQRLREGADFSQVAAKESQVADSDGGLWGTFEKSELKDEQLRNLVFTCPVGEISKPLDTEDGMVIVKVLDRAGIDSPMAAQTATVKLARILFLLGEYRKIPDEAALRIDLEKNRLASLQRDWLAGLMKTSRLEYPNGTNFWPEAKKGKQGL